MTDIDATNAKVVYEVRSPERQAADANVNTIRLAAAGALATNKAYVALAAPTAAQTTAHVKALSRQQNGIIRLLLGQLDATD